MDYTITQGPLTLTLPTCTRRVSISRFFYAYFGTENWWWKHQNLKKKQMIQFAKTVFLPT